MDVGLQLTIIIIISSSADDFSTNWLIIKSLKCEEIYEILHHCSS